MKSDAIRELAANPTALKRLAKFMAQQCFRNSHIEEIHAGKEPQSKIGDYSDVIVHTPTGDIPWTVLSRITQDEMKTLNKEVADKCLVFLKLLLGEPKVLLDGIKCIDFVPDWDTPRAARVRRRRLV